MTLHNGQPQPLGAHFDGDGVNFALFSAAAERVELCLFDGEQERRLTLPGRSGDVWHGYLPQGRPGLRYGFRVSGPGARCNPNKLLLDPCARRLDGRVPDDARLLGDNDQDSAAAMPKCVVVDESYDWRDDRFPATPWARTVIYEAHVRGLTRLHPAIPAELRGTYAALSHPAMVDYLQRLGVTALELLPVQQHADEPRLQRQGLRNYWGYNVLLPFAADNGLASGDDPLNELRDAVRALHQAGIEVILDLVFNHSAELDRDGPTLTLRGIDDAGYYWLTDDGDYHNWTGCGNALRLDSPATVDWVADCLRFWREACHVDGFRFDLATVLGRTPDFSADAPLFAALRRHPALQGCKLIAEPWDVGPGGYQLGRFPPPWAEWNDRFRDDVRRFWLWGDLPLGAFARRFAASSDVFQHDERAPWASVNLLTAHDGFTLRDLVSFNDKRNDANGEGNRDGSDHNFSHNHGTEGLAADDDVQARRRASQRALLTSLLLAQGVPMLLAGDEFGNSQRGNNNAYCQDNELAWLDWPQAEKELAAFTAGLIRLRQAIPALQQAEWWREGGGEARWLNARGEPLTPWEWEQGEHRLQILLSERWLLLFNASQQPCEMRLPEGEWWVAPPFSVDDTPVHGGVWRGGANAACVLYQDT